MADPRAVQTARDTLAAYDAGGEQDSDGRWWSVNHDPDYWAGRLAAALRMVLPEAAASSPGDG